MLSTGNHRAIALTSRRTHSKSLSSRACMCRSEQECVDEPQSANHFGCTTRMLHNETGWNTANSELTMKTKCRNWAIVAITLLSLLATPARALDGFEAFSPRELARALGIGCGPWLPHETLSNVSGTGTQQNARWFSKPRLPGHPSRQNGHQGPL